ncbi:hypothetical protein SLE2022_207660 [Rubroshorea leprosula]
MISALDDFLETSTLEKVGSFCSQIDEGVLSLNVGEQIATKDREVDSDDRQLIVKEITGLSSPFTTSSSPPKLKLTFSYITKLLELITS